MTRHLLDVNVLIALHDPSHVHHEAAHTWFSANRQTGWATCPTTINGCVRIMSHPNYKSVETTAAEILRRLHKFCNSSGHEFWPENLALFDPRHFKAELVTGAAQIADICLVAIALANGGRLATFDRRIPWSAVVGASEATIELI